MRFFIPFVIAIASLSACKKQTATSDQLATPAKQKTVEKPAIQLELRGSIQSLILKSANTTVLNMDEQTLSEDKCLIPASAFPLKLKAEINPNQRLQDMGLLTNYFVSFTDAVSATTEPGYANTGKPCPFQEGWVKFINIVPHGGMDDSPEAPEETVTTTKTSSGKQTAPKPAADKYKDPDYNESFAKLLIKKSTQVSGKQGQCGTPNGFYRGDCYECAANAIDAAVEEMFKVSGVTYKYPELNMCEYARSFADGWQNSKHQKPMHLKKTWDINVHGGSGTIQAKNAPLGSVIVWDVCGRESYCSASGKMGIGHIGFVTKEGGKQICSSLCASLDQLCGNPNRKIIAVFQPVN